LELIVYPDFPHLNRFLSYRIGILRWVRRHLMRIGIGYVVLPGDEQALWSLASKHVPLFGSSLSTGEVDRILESLQEWASLRSQILPSDRIYPFAINLDTMAMRLGYVVLRNGKPIGGVVVISS
jgi:hypothetical protein